MLHLTLGAALFAGATTSPTSVDAYLAHIPTDCSAVAQFGDVAAMLNRPEDERGSWESFLADDRVLGMLLETLAAEGMDDESLEGTDALMRTIRGGAIGFNIDDVNADDFAVHGVMKTADEFISILGEIAVQNDTELVETEIDGQPAFVLGSPDDDGPAMTLMDVGELMLMTVGPEASAADALRGMRAAAGADQADPWWTGLAGRVPDAMVEMMVNFGAIDPVDDDMAEAQNYLDSIYLGMGIGEGNRSDLTMQFNLAENDVVAELAGHFGTPSDELFYLAPEGALAVQAYNIDMLGLVQSIVGLVDEFDPDAGAGDGYDEAMAAAAGALGIDFETDILGNFSGDFFMVQWPADGFDPADPESVGELLPVIGLSIGDQEPFLELMETAVPLLQGMAEIVEEDDFTALDLTVPGLAVTVMATADTLYVGESTRLDEVRARRGAKRGDGAFGSDLIEDAIAASGAGGLGLVNLDLAADLVLLAMESDPSVELPEELLGIYAAFAEHVGGVGYSTFDVTSSRVIINMATR